MVMTKDQKTHNMHFFKDDEGKVIVWQWPNIPIYGWLVFKLLSMLIHHPQLQGGFDGISKAFLFTWAYLELTQGVNYFRRLLGLLVFIALIIGFVKP